MLEVLGYAASVLIAISLMMRSVTRLRLINLVGAACFAVYGYLIHAFPVAVMNGLIVLINVYHLTRLLRTRTAFDLVEARPESPYLRVFLDFHRDDLLRYFPAMTEPIPPASCVHWILRDALPVGVVIAEAQGADTLFVHLDYVIPGYRDLRPGRYFYQRVAPRWSTQGITRILTAGGPPAHQSYLKAMGFQPLPDNPGLFGRPLSPPDAATA